MEVINALARNTIDFRRAELILRALHIAVRNARRVRFNANDGDMVREVPTYPAPPKPAHSRPRTLNRNQRPTPNPSSTLGHPSPRARPADPTNRKPPARAGLPAEPQKAATQVKAAKSGKLTQPLTAENRELRTRISPLGYNGL